jgi:hypothetical protein
MPSLRWYARLLLMFWKIEPICGPSRISVPITTMATNAMIRAYSMSPWPLDLANRCGMMNPPISLSPNVTFRSAASIA